MGQCLTRGTLLQNCLRGSARGSCWWLGAAGHHVLWKPTSCRSLLSEYIGTRRQNSSPALSPVHSTDEACQLNIMPSGKEKIFKGPRFHFTEQAKRVNLKLRGTTLLTATVPLFDDSASKCTLTHTSTPMQQQQ